MADSLVSLRLVRTHGAPQVWRARVADALVLVAVQLAVPAATIVLVLVLSARPARQTPPTEALLSPAAPDTPTVRLRGVTFCYAGSDEGVSDLTFDVRRGRITALTPDLLTTWRARVAYVPQETVLLPGTVRWNLVWSSGRTDVADEECWTALEPRPPEHLGIEVVEGEVPIGRSDPEATQHWFHVEPGRVVVSLIGGTRVEITDGADATVDLPEHVRASGDSGWVTQESTVVLGLRSRDTACSSSTSRSARNGCVSWPRTSHVTALPRRSSASR